MDIGQVAAWLSTALHVVLCLALVVVALVRTRQTSAMGAHLIAAGGGAQALSSCCMRAMASYRVATIDTGSYVAGERLMMASQAASLVANVIVSGLLIAGFAVTARALRAGPRSIA